MTDRERAIVMAYTGACMLTGDKFQIFHKYVEDIMGRPIMTHEIGFLADSIKEKAKADFIALCSDDGGWIPVSERLPEANEYVGDVAKYYLVQNEYGDMLVARYRSSSHTHNTYWEPIYQLKPYADKIVAWMPLPEPYEAESEGKEEANNE